MLLRFLVAAAFYKFFKSHVQRPLYFTSNKKTFKMPCENTYRSENLQFNSAQICLIFEHIHQRNVNPTNHIQSVSNSLFYNCALSRTTCHLKAINHVRSVSWKHHKCIQPCTYSVALILHWICMSVWLLPFYSCSHRSNQKVIRLLQLNTSFIFFPCIICILFFPFTLLRRNTHVWDPLPPWQLRLWHHSFSASYVSNKNKCDSQLTNMPTIKCFSDNKTKQYDQQTLSIYSTVPGCK